jgi:UDP-2,3-diacylglucosamine hydrolase
MIVFVSDLHLCAERPAITELFVRFLRERATGAEALYVLGDLFEAWLGDDCVLPEHEEVLEALASTVAAGTPVHVMPGTRDFLLGEGFAARTGCRLLGDAAVIDLYGAPTLLLHGDTLCTDDHPYQQMRTQLRDPQWIAQFLAKAPEERLAFARELRAVSAEATGGKAAEVMDVNPEAVRQSLRTHGARRLIHGHTHRAGRHTLDLGGEGAERWVLGDWYAAGSVLVCEPEGCRLEQIGLG